MSLPLRTRGVLAGLVTLVASPLIAVTVLGGSQSHTLSPTAASSREARPTAVAGSIAASRGVALRIPELAAREPEPPAPPTPVPSAAPSPEATATPAPTATRRPVILTPKVSAPAPAPAAAPAPPAAAAPSGSIEGIIRDAAGRHGVSGDWMMRIARCESGLNPRAVNPSGYYGLFQFSPRTFQAHGGTDIYDPYQQSEITATMLSQGQARQWSCA